MEAMEQHVQTVRPYFEQNGHLLYLQNKTYDRYLHMHKVMVGERGSEELLTIGDELSGEELPTYLDAAGWAYAEAGLASTESTTVERVARVAKAEALWQQSLEYQTAMREYLGDIDTTEVEGYRTAVNLACAPLIKSIIIGNVQEEVLRSVLGNVAEIAQLSRKALDTAYEEGDTAAGAYHRGFLFEASALMALLYMDDPRYVPLPATARGDTGYYHREQTHDISIINQHWGEIRKVIPVEIKSKASQRDKRRYKALIIPGRVRLSAEGVDPRETVNAFYDIAQGSASMRQVASVEKIAAQLREMLRLYQKGASVGETAVRSVTRFHESSVVAEQYPELVRRPPGV